MAISASIPACGPLPRERPEVLIGPARRRRATRLRRLAPALLGLLLLAAGFAWWDLMPPAAVAWERVDLGGTPVWQAPDLVLQEQRGESTWASYGFSIFRSHRGGPFERVHTLQPPLGEIWGAYSKTARAKLRHHEMVELVALGEERLLAFAAGEVHRIDLANGADEVVHRMRFFGRGVGRGLMPMGVTVDDRGAIYYGEYVTKRLGPTEGVRIYRSSDQGATWQVAHEFAPQAVRHVHAVQWDPHGRALWVATGDRDEESRIGYSTDGGASFTWIGHGSQAFRAVSLLFAPDSVSWVMDSPAEPSRWVRWDRASQRIARSEDSFPSPGYYTQALADGRGLATLGETSASVWMLEKGEAPQRLFDWTVTANPALPHPVVRLPRRSDPASRWIYLNPLRTHDADARIYRIAAEDTLPAAIRVADLQTARGAERPPVAGVSFQGEIEIRLAGEKLPESRLEVGQRGGDLFYRFPLTTSALERPGS